MKVTLDLTRLLEQGAITKDEHDRLLKLGSHDTGSLAINILLGFGVIAVAGSLGALVPTPETAIVLGLVLFVSGYAAGARGAEQWWLLSQICLVLGGLMVSVGVVGLGEGSVASIAIVTVLLATAAIAARSSLLMVAAVLALAATLGARTAYRHAVYSLSIHEPLLTIVVFSALALLAYLVSKRLSSDYERVAINAARAAVLIVNFGFWIGSLWGDRLAAFGGSMKMAVVIPTWPFTVGWALALLAVGVWGVRANRRWVVNVAAVFGAIHLYTQWFWLLGASPLSILAGGLLLLALAYAGWTLNRRFSGPSPAPVAQPAP